MKRCRLGTAVCDGESNQDVVLTGFGVLRDDVEVAPRVEDPGVGQLEFEVELGSLAVDSDELIVREPADCGYL